MRGSLAVLSVCLLFATGACRPAPTDGGAVLAIENVTVIPMDGRGVLPLVTVVIRDGRIASVAAAGAAEVPAHAQRVDGRGRYLLPSFVDTHVHLDHVGDFAVLQAHGIGAVRNMEGAPYHLHVRELVDAGVLPGALFRTCGPYTNAPGIGTPSEAEAAVREQHAAGYDCVKIHGDLSLESLEALGRVAGELGIPVVGHAPRNLDLADALPTGAIREISHAEEFLYAWYAYRSGDGWAREAARVTRQAGVSVAPTLAMYRSILRQVQDLDAELARLPLESAGPFARRAFRPSANRYRKKFKPDDAAWLADYLALQKSLVAALRDAGVTLLTGTDANAPVAVPGFALHEELEVLVEAGLTPLEALEAGTRAGWDSLAGAGTAGRVAEGLLAELVLLDANPLADIRNSRRVAGLVARGEFIDADALQAAAGEQVRRYAADQPFVDLLWDNDISDAMSWYAGKRAEDGGYRVSRETLACQALRAERDGAPETALETVEVLLEHYPADPLGLRLRSDLAGGNPLAAPAGVTGG